MSGVAELVEQLAHDHLEGWREAAHDEIIAKCPFHTDKSPSFAINKESGLWICYAGCGSGGLPYLLHLLGVSRREADAVLAPHKEKLERAQKKKRKLDTSTDPFRAVYVLPEALLGVYDPETPYLPWLKAGFTEKTLRRFEVGFDRKTRRVTFPIRDVYGNLAGISGRATRTGDIPKYRVYQKELQEFYPGYDIEKSRHIWNLNFIYDYLNTHHTQPIAIVEGFKACMWMVQHGYPYTVALMGSSLSLEQQTLLQRLGCPITLFLDNDEAGIGKTVQIGDILYGKVPDLRVVHYPFEHFAQPDSFTDEELGWLVEEAPSFLKWLHL